MLDGSILRLPITDSMSLSISKSDHRFLASLKYVIARRRPYSIAVVSCGTVSVVRQDFWIPKAWGVAFILVLKDGMKVSRTMDHTYTCLGTSSDSTLLCLTHQRPTHGSTYAPNKKQRQQARIKSGKLEARAAYAKFHRECYRSASSGA
jgi:hypothetical protein